MDGWLYIIMYTWCSVGGIRGDGQSSTASGKVEQLLPLTVAHVTHHPPKHPNGGRAGWGGGDMIIYRQL